MIRNIRIFIRNLMRQKSISLLALGSLSVGIAVALLIGLWVVEELSFDHFHKYGNHIYRVIHEDRDQNENTSTYRELGDDMKNSFPEVKERCRMVYTNLEYEVGELIFQDIKAKQADENFFTFFSFPLMRGDAASCLDAPGKMVVSESVAGKWFPGKDAVGQVVKAEGMDWQVTAVMKDIPYNSHIQADVVMHFYGAYDKENATGDVFRTYVYAPEIPDLKALEQRFSQLPGPIGNMIAKMGHKYKLQPLKAIHFSGVYSDHMGNKSLVVILTLTALAILLIACINFINLFVAVSFLRVREIGVRKTFGAGKKNLVMAFYRETLEYVLLAAAVAMVLAILFLPLFNRLADYRLSLGFDTPFLYIYLAGVVVFTFFVAGSYPAFHMTRFGVADTLGVQFRGKKLSLLQNSLLVLQFSVSIVFVIMIFFVHKQVNYMVNYDLGFDKENVVCMRVRPELLPHYNAVRDELLKNPAIKDVTLRDELPMDWADGFPIMKPGSEDMVQFEICQVESNYLDMMGMKLVEGENPFYTRANNCIVIDETAVKDLGLEEPLGASLNIWWRDFIIKGVVRSTQNKTLKQEGAHPVVYMLVREQSYRSDYYMMCKVSGNPQKGIAAMQGMWERYSPEVPFKYQFLDAAYQELYESETRLGNMFLCAMLVMLLLSMSGLFAIAYYTMQRKIKEVGVRKVNGAKIWDLLVLLNTGFIRLVLVAFVIGGTLSYYFASYWLENFSVRTELSWWVFAVAGLAAVAVALLTVFFLTLRAARMNPVDALKGE